MLQILTAIGSKDKGNFICAPLAYDVLLVFRLDTLGIFLALVIDYRRDVNGGLLSFHNTHKLKSNKQSIICIAVLAHRRISGPLCNGKISPFLWTGSLGIAQIIGVGFPAEFTKLFVNQIAGFSLGKFHALGRSFPLFCTFLGCLGRCCSRYCLDLLRERNDFFFLLLDDSLIVRLGHIFGHDKSRGNISPVTIYLHKPDRKVIGHGEQSLCILHGVSASMHGIISGLAKRIQDVINFLGNQAFPLQQTNPVGVCIVDGWLLDMLKSKNLKNQALTEHTKLIHTCIRVRIYIAFSCCTDL